MDAVKLVVVFVLIILALRRKVSVAVTLFGAGLFVALLFWLPVPTLLQGYWDLVKSERFLTLTSVIILITILGSLLKELQFLDRLGRACQGLRGGSRTAVSILPGLVGLMPMPGGSLLSAPLVENVLKDEDYKPEFKVVANYWFRHIVEFFWPVYPGLILTGAITGMKIFDVSLLQFPLSVGMATIGYFFFIRKIKPTGGGNTSFFKALGDMSRSLWPIVLAIVLYAALQINLAYAILISLVLLIVTAHPSKSQLITSLKSGLTIKLVFLVFGILSFQTVLELTGAIQSIPQLAVTFHLPPQLVICMVCFTVGILTGMVSAFVGLGYTLLAGFMYQPVLIPENILLGYLSGYLGMMLSPTHLCLILTNEYFGSQLSRVYRLFLPPILIFFALGILLSLSPWPALFSLR